MRKYFPLWFLFCFFSVIVALRAPTAFAVCGGPPTTIDCNSLSPQACVQAAAYCTGGIECHGHPAVCPGLSAGNCYINPAGCTLECVGTLECNSLNELACSISGCTWTPDGGTPGSNVTPGALCGGNPLCDPASALEEMIKLIVRFITWVPWFAVIAGVIFMLIGAFSYITAGDAPKKAEKARMTIIYAVVGIILSGALYVFMRILIAVIPGLSNYIT